MPGLVDGEFAVIICIEPAAVLPEIGVGYPVENICVVSLTFLLAACQRTRRTH